MVEDHGWKAAHKMSTNYRKWSNVRADRTDLTDRGLAEARRKLLAGFTSTGCHGDRRRRLVNG
jgi:hypothetical protein